MKIGLALTGFHLASLEQFGDSAEASVGKIVILYSIMAPFRGQIVPALRLRIPPPKDGAKAAPPPPPVDDDLDEVEDEL